MTYSAVNDLPEGVKNSLPKHAQEIYKEAFNNAFDEHENEQTAHKIAWGAVKRSYEKSDDGWHKKD